MGRGVAVLTAALVLGGADAAGESSAVSPPQTVTSRDGGLTVAVPRGALRRPAKVRIRVLKRSPLLPELRKAKLRPGATLYRLEPSGVRFLKPVTITRRIDAKAAGFDLKRAVPGIALATRSESGKWEFLKGLRARPAGNTLVVSGTTRHFSELAALEGDVRVSPLDPKSVDLGVGDRFTARFTVTDKRPDRREKIRVFSAQWEATGSIKLPLDADGDTIQEEVFECATPGPGTFAAGITIRDQNFAPVRPNPLTSGTYDEFFLLPRNPGICRPKPLALEFACVVVTHSPVGPFPSFTSWLVQFAASTLPQDPVAALTVDGVNNGQPVTGAVNATTGKASLIGGINSFGEKRVQSLAVNGQNVTSQLVAKVGAAPTVTASEGVIAGQCPP